MERCNTFVRVLLVCELRVILNDVSLMPGKIFQGGSYDDPQSTYSSAYSNKRYVARLYARLGRKFSCSTHGTTRGSSQTRANYRTNLGCFTRRALLGSRLGFAALALYLLEGLAFPVFAGGAIWVTPGTFFSAGYSWLFPLQRF
jgi:hypothetical protein